eukprot:gene12777-8715_t
MLPSDIEHLSKMLDKNSGFKRPEGQVTGFSLEAPKEEQQHGEEGSSAAPVSDNKLAAVPAVALPPTVVDQQLHLPAPSLSKKAALARHKGVAEASMHLRPRGNELWSQEELKRMMVSKVPVHLIAAAATGPAVSRCHSNAAAEAQVGKQMNREEPVYTVLQQEKRTAEDVYLGVDFTRDGAGADGVVVKIEMPKLTQVSDLSIYVEAFQLYVASPDYYLNAALPRKCVAGKANASWDDKKKTLEVRLVADNAEDNGNQIKFTGVRIYADRKKHKKVKRILPNFLLSFFSFFLFHMSYVKVSLLTCQQKVFCRSLRSTVLSCKEIEVAHTPVTGSPKNPTSKGDTTVTTMYNVVCEDSVLFPKGGGQACDYGWLFLSEEDFQRSMERQDLADHYPTAIQGGEEEDLNRKGIPVTCVERDGDCCVMTTPIPLPVGATVWQKLDWPRRLDNMQHHTGQHLLTAVVEQLLGIKTTSVAFAEPYAYVQLDVEPLLKDPSSYPFPDCVQVSSDPAGKTKGGRSDRQLTPQAIELLQNRCNELIGNPNSTVRISIYPSRQACMDAMAARESGSKFRSRSIPADVTGPIRTIIIDGVDECTCCGTHVEHLSQLNALYIIPHQDVKGSIIKLYFVVGQRAAKYYQEMCRREKELTIQLSGCRPQDFMKELQERSKATIAMEKKMKKWIEELAQLQAGALLQSGSGMDQDGCDTLAYGVLVHRRDDVEIEYFTAFRNAMDALGYYHVLLVAGWVPEGTGPQQGQLWVSESLAKAVTAKKKRGTKADLEAAEAPKATKVSESILMETVVQVLQKVFPDVRGGVSKQGYRGKSSTAASLRALSGAICIKEKLQANIDIWKNNIFTLTSIERVKHKKKVTAFPSNTLKRLLPSDGDKIYILFTYFTALNRTTHMHDTFKAYLSVPTVYRTLFARILDFSVSSPIMSSSDPTIRLENMEDKVANLSRVVSIAQNLSEERYRELQRENVELKARLRLLENIISVNVQGEIEQMAVKQSNHEAGLNHTMEQLREQIQKVREAQHSTEQHEKDQIQKVIGGVKEDLRLLLEAHNSSMEKLFLHQEERLISTALHHVKTDSETTRVWAKRNLERLREQLSNLRADVSSLQAGQQVRPSECPVEGKCKELKALLKKKTGEVDLMVMVMDKELQQTTAGCSSVSFAFRLVLHVLTAVQLNSRNARHA